MNRLTLLLLFSAVPGLFGAPKDQKSPTIVFPTAGPTVPGMQARLDGNVAAAPELAPITVKRAIWAANDLRTKPYRFGGGHHSFSDNAYDCSATVSYMLAGAGLIKAPMSSSDLRKFGESGRGRWITVYARNGHTFAIIAGLGSTPPHTRRRTTSSLRAGDRLLGSLPLASKRATPQACKVLPRIPVGRNPSFASCGS